MSTFKSLFAATLLSLLSSFAVADIVVIGHPSADPLTQAQVSDLYLGKARGSTLVDQPEGSDIYADFYQKATGRNVSQVKSTWARLVFSGNAQAPQQQPNAAAVKQTVANDSRAIGYIKKSEVDSSVKVLLELN